MASSAIEWTDEVWNPVTGCSRVSPGCAHCYALELAPRLRRFARGREAKGKTGGKWLSVADGDARSGSGPAFGVTLHPDVLREPLRWRRPRKVFVNSMSDLFHEEVPFEYIAAVFGVMGAAAQHTFQVLTKRPERMLEFFVWYREECRDHELVADEMPWLGVYRARDLDVDGLEMADACGYDWPLPNVWLGVSIENRRFVARADVLRQVPAAVRFISAEPLLGPLLPDGDYMVDADGDTYEIGNADFRAWRPWADGHTGPALDLELIDWLIVGGESGSGHRPMAEAWVRALRDLCADSCWQGEREGSTAFFFKQWGGLRPGGDTTLDGRVHHDFPPGVSA